MTDQLTGILTALATPFTPDGAIDEKLLRRLVDRSVDGGVDGVVACGSTGEFAAMTGDERRLLVETVIDQSAGRVPVIAQTGAVSTREAVALSQHAEAAGADVLMVVTPYYEPLTMDETLHYLATVADSVQIPVMLYNLPGATGVNLDPDTVGALAHKHPNIKYIKDTTGDMSQAGKLIHHHSDVISTFIGWDALLLAAVAEGAAGVMAGTANVMPAQLVAVHRALLAGDLAGARKQWDRIYPLMDTLMSAPFIPAVKAALEEIGLPVGGPREPMLPVNTETRTRIAAALNALPELTNAQ
ncbi:4-hydroxy-tetrahydrodipicolinate synthase [Streptomyces sp. LHD-70]|uniref:4-hydroxy-tetrahydrodipicolinate synthase n=1 Tax=Streptomyces sp. LHD-70 TaxID=3072140 RepID=UPI0028103CDF|nr:4-hydroxy-tetrahydrodipicolinate synthase [Streptomyces sp. LHD-70]MDQ8704083.1 4-hydroxy-tetrahydrodipicolinate synthase [Streptomyces sp. LHD-70]